MAAASRSGGKLRIIVFYPTILICAYFIKFIVVGCYRKKFDVSLF